MTGKISEDPDRTLDGTEKYAAAAAGGSWGVLGATLATWLASLTQTLTNKAINAGSNTISNITTGNFAFNVIDADGTLAANSDTRLATQKAVKTYADAHAGGGGGTAAGVNVVINGDFRINQTGYVSAAALAAGAYGHDQWKAGAAGGNYSFTQLKSSTQITIASGKSLIQPIEDANVVGGSYVLSWTGTAQGRAGVNTLTPSGAYAASPLSITGQTAGTVMSIEFNAGTLGTVKLESGTTATAFIMRSFDQDLATCRRYWQQVYVAADFPTAAGSSVNMAVGVPFGVTMRAAPTTLTATVGAVGTSNATVSTGDAQPYGCYFQMQSIAAGRFYWYGSVKADARL